MRTIRAILKGQRITVSTAIALAILVAAASAGTTWHVNASAPPGGNGSAQFPFQTIQAGLDAAATGDTVLLADGTYTGVGNRDLDFFGKDLALVGAGGAAACVVDGAGPYSPMTLSNGETRAALIEGITFYNFKLGILLDGASPTIVDCRFWFCGLGYYTWGGLMAVDSAPAVLGCSFEDCGSWGRGGGIYLSPGTAASDLAIIDRTTFLRCRAVYGGGGAVYVDGNASVVISRSRFIENIGGEQGGALAIRGPLDLPAQPVGSGTLVQQCLFAGNVGTWCGAILVANPGGWEHRTAVIDGCTIVGNQSYNGSALEIRDWADVLLTNSVVSRNRAAYGGQISSLGKLRVTHCNVSGGFAEVLVGDPLLLDWGPGNLRVDPRFASPAGPDGDPLTFSDNDYTLLGTSRCLDAGSNALVLPDFADLDGDGDLGEPVPFDLDGLPRFVDLPYAPNTGTGPGPIVDIGCFERQL